jgi:hypothetical protein
VCLSLVAIASCGQCDLHETLESSERRGAGDGAGMGIGELGDDVATSPNASPVHPTYSVERHLQV